jgi:two-component system, NarL family, nitrate/nitrite response regulator NarL
LGDPTGGLVRRRMEVFVLVAVRVYREGIVDAVERDPRFHVIGSAATLAAAWPLLEALPRPPDITLIDLASPDGTSAARALRRGWPSSGIVAVGVGEADPEVVRWAEAGVSGLVSREATLAELLDAIEAAAKEEVVTSPAVAAALLRRVASFPGETRRNSPALTRREREIVGLIGRGLSNKEIASSLRIEIPTVKNHVHNILEKLRVGRRVEAVLAASERGELDGA